jgi:hypothetical protein
MKLVEKPKLNLETIIEDMADMTYCLSEMREDLDYYRSVMLNPADHVKHNKVNHELMDKISGTIDTFNNIESGIWETYLKLLKNEEDKSDR